MSRIVPQPFKLRVPDDVLVDLRARLANARWPDEVARRGWRYGSDLAYMKELVAYWRDRFDWRAQEAKLNSFPQFTVPMGQVDLHFIQMRGVGPKPLPLLLSHGWPGSVWEFHRIIPLLTDPGAHGGDPEDAFTVVAPSLPGYGFSYKPNQTRFGVAEIADVFARLMTDVLGYKRFGAQGGDWGAFITSRLGLAYAGRLAGIHVNLLGLRRDLAAPAEPTDEEKTYLEELRRWEREETGYQCDPGHQAPDPRVRPHRFSPSGSRRGSWRSSGPGAIAAATSSGGSARTCCSPTSCSTGSAAPSTRRSGPYFARRHGAWPLPDNQRIEVPTAYASFPREILHPPRAWAEKAYNIKRWTMMPAGGHFAALEEPAALAADIRAFFRDLR